MPDSPTDTPRPDSSLDRSERVLGNMASSDVVDFVTSNLEEAKHRMQPIAALQDACWMLYRNREDFSDKEDWQSQVPLPKAYSVVKHAAANIIKLFMMSDKIVRVKGWGMEALLAPWIERGMNELFRSSEFQFIDALEDALESALSCDMGILKSFPILESIDPVDFSGKGMETNISLRCKAVDFRRFWFGPYSTSQKFDWCAETSSIPHAYLRASDRYEKKALRAIERESYGDKEEDIKSWARFDFAQPWMRTNLRLNMVEVLEWYGDVVDRSYQKDGAGGGQIAARNQKITIFNRKHLAKIEDYHGQPPYVVFSPLNVAFRFPGEGIIAASRQLFRAATRLANLKVDSQFYSELKQFEVDLSLLENKEDIVTGIEPGKMYRKRQGTNAIPAIREIQVSGNKPTSFEMDARIDQEIQRGTFIADPMTSAPATGTTDLATELQGQTAATVTMLLNMAERIERNGLDKLARIVFGQMLLYLDSTTRPNWSLLLGAPNQLDQLTAEERKRIIGTNYNFEFTGLSEQLWLQERSKHIIETLQIVQDNPMYQAMIDLPRMFTDLLKGIGTVEYLHPQAQENFQRLMAQMLQEKENEAQNKIALMGKQFELRNTEAMKRDIFKHELARDDKMADLGIEAGRGVA